MWKLRVYPRLAAGWLVSLLIAVLLMSCTGRSADVTPSQSATTDPTSTPTTTSTPPATSTAVTSKTPAATTATASATASAATTSPPRPTPITIPMAVNEITLDAARPDSFTNYTDPNGVFAIAYPQDWFIPETEWFHADNASQVVIDYYETGEIPRDVIRYIFIIRATNFPRMYVYFFPRLPQPLPSVITRTPGEKIPRSYSRTLIDGKEAIILEQSGYDPDNGYLGSMSIEILLKKSHFRIDFWESQDKYYDWRDTFLHIAASFDVLKEY